MIDKYNDKYNEYLIIMTICNVNILYDTIN